MTDPIYVRDRLSMAVLKLRGRGGEGPRVANARSDLSAVFEADLPESARPRYRSLKAALEDGSLDSQQIAAGLEELRASL